MQHHFVSAAVPPRARNITSRWARRAATRCSPTAAAEDRAGWHHRSLCRKGIRRPKLQAQLKTSSRLELTADYGKLTILAQPLFWLLQKVHGFIGNWAGRSSS